MVDFAMMTEAAKAKRLKALGLTEDGIDQDDAAEKEFAAAVAIEKSKIMATLFDGLTNDQDKALRKLIDWVRDPSEDARFFVLKGFSGTGKTFLTGRFRLYVTKVLDRPFVSSAPTNKATKVIRESADPNAKTIYSILKMSMVEDEEDKVLERTGTDLGLAIDTVLDVDEASMVNASIDEAVAEAARDYSLKVLFVGDPAQLRPVGELSSPAWQRATKPEHKAILREVRRFDNQLLHLSIVIREELKEVVRDDGRPRIRVSDLIVADNDGLDTDNGVYVETRKKFQKRITDLAASSGASAFVNVKVLAWRNRVVSEYNAMIRTALGFTEEFHIGECISIASPVTQTIHGKSVIIATIDDEFTVVDIQETVWECPGLLSVEAWVLTMETGLRLTIPKEEETAHHDNCQKLALAAKRETDRRKRKEKWGLYWEIRQSFHSIRYSYSLTCHRSQGSTLKTVFVDAGDVMSNSDREERLQCIYVACTRPTTSMYTFV